ncbi:MAG: hypothetical protein Q9226_005084, partial [Calogaya cf. arnoldii]
TNVTPKPPISLLAGIPPGFTMNTHVIDQATQFSGGDVALVAANTLESLMFQLRHVGRIDGTFSDVPGSNIQMSLVSVEEPPSRFAAWAVQRTFEAAHRRLYVSIRSFMIWHGKTVGHIEFNRREQAALTGKPKIAGGNLTLEDDDSTTINPAKLQDGHQLQLQPGYTGVPMPLYDVMLTILTVMVLSIEEGPDAPCDNIMLPHFKLRSVGQPLLTYGEVLVMMRRLARWIVGQDRYQEVAFLINRDGERIAMGSVTRE